MFLEGEDFDLSAIVYQANFESQLYLGRTLVLKLESLGIPLDELLQNIALYLDDSELHQSASNYLHEASQALRRQTEQRHTK